MRAAEMAAILLSALVAFLLFARLRERTQGNDGALHRTDVKSACQNQL